MQTAIENAECVDVKSNPDVKKLWRITLVTQSLIGITNGFYLYTYGPYFYEKFGGSSDPKTAMLLMTILLGLRQGLVALFEVPTGALADAIGRVNVIILSWIMRIFFFVSLAAIWFSHSTSTAFLLGIIASIGFAFCYTLFNGSFSAWCMETIREKAPQITYGWLASRYFGYHALGEIVGGLSAIFFYVYGYAHFGFLIAALLSFAGYGYAQTKMEESGLLSFLNIRDVHLSVITRRIGEIIGKGVKVCAKTPVLFWIILTYGAFMFLLNLVKYLWPVFLKTNFGTGQNFVRNWILIMVGSQLLMACSSRLLVWLNKKWTADGGIKRHFTGFQRIFIGTALVSAISILILSLDTAFHIFALYSFPVTIVIVILSFGIIAPCFETLVNAYIPVEDAQYRTTVMSAGSMLRSFLILLLAIPSGGGSGETTTIGWALPATLLLIATILSLIFMRKTDIKVRTS